MLDFALIGTLALMGLASAPHCALMCGGLCTAASASGGAMAQGRVLGFQMGRLAGYAAAGALASLSMAWLRESSSALVALRPVWTFAHVALFTLGAYLLIRGQWPAWLGRWGQRCAGGSPQSAAAGALWVVWPCGALQGALLVAALANTPTGGAAAMAAFALASSPGLLLAPLAWRRLGARHAAWAPRLAGLMLLGASAWALGHGLWQRVVELCT